MTIKHVDPERSIVTCPFCGVDNEISGPGGDDVCEHFVEFRGSGFVFDSEQVDPDE